MIDGWVRLTFSLLHFEVFIEQELDLNEGHGQSIREESCALWICFPPTCSFCLFTLLPLFTQPTLDALDTMKQLVQVGDMGRFVLFTTGPQGKGGEGWRELYMEVGGAPYIPC